jgi:hypothetical protein
MLVRGKHVSCTGEYITPITSVVRFTKLKWKRKNIDRLLIAHFSNKNILFNVFGSELSSSVVDPDLQGSALFW